MRKEDILNLIRIVRDCGLIYDPLFCRKKAEELEVVARKYVESYYHLGKYYMNNIETSFWKQMETAKKAVETYRKTKGHQPSRSKSLAACLPGNGPTQAG